MGWDFRTDTPHSCALSYFMQRRFLGGLGADVGNQRQLHTWRAGPAILAASPSKCWEELKFFSAACSLFVVLDFVGWFFNSRMFSTPPQSAVVLLLLLKKRTVYFFKLVPKNPQPFERQDVNSGASGRADCFLCLTLLPQNPDTAAQSDRHLELRVCDTVYLHPALKSVLLLAGQIPPKRLL